ncbi:hypothetical protein [Erythrobacter sanguineus]|uniref:Uncharacterized protein n=1 Tax=Erythrobacter sanguineus TaxID=198312 RepID=A0A1M7RQ82_9SPHN|nr:hypothetical protein [Erythrobacter sanguineus]SHN48389.1 hypothetical protein SAMN02745193_00130 [Erythrobacter sanguineus]
MRKLIIAVLLLALLAGGALVKRLRRVEDGEAVGVLTASAALCAIGVG